MTQSRRLLLRYVCAALFLVVAAAATIFFLMLDMPKRSFVGSLPPAEIAPLEDSLRESVEAIVGTPPLARAATNVVRRAEVATYLEERLMVSGPVTSEAVGDAHNLYVDHVGTRFPEEIVVVGANYDTVAGSPGADTNASGCAVLLWLAAEFAAGTRPERTVRYALFTNKETPYFHTESMGSLVHARSAKARGETIVAMLNLQSLGVYSDDKGSQHYPFPLSLLYPDVGNFVAFVGDVGSRQLVRRAIGAFRMRTPFPSEGAALPALLPGVGWSDHWSFREVGVPAVMASDTAMFRNEHFGKPTDTVDTLDFSRLARVALGIADVVAELGSGESPTAF